MPKASPERCSKSPRISLHVKESNYFTVQVLNLLLRKMNLSTLDKGCSNLCSLMKFTMQRFALVFHCIRLINKFSYNIPLNNLKWFPFYKCKCSLLNKTLFILITIIHSPDSALTVLWQWQPFFYNRCTQASLLTIFLD